MVLHWQPEPPRLEQTEEFKPTVAQSGKGRVPGQARRGAKYVAIDNALREIAESRPNKHGEVFKALDGRLLFLAPSRSRTPAGGARAIREIPEPHEFGYRRHGLAWVYPVSGAVQSSCSN
jgi:hypothetical protein